MCGKIHMQKEKWMNQLNLPKPAGKMIKIYIHIKRRVAFEILLPMKVSN